MILNFKVENYLSILDLQEIDFTTNKIFNSSTAELKNNLLINKINCMVGANGSGKTKLLNAMCFILWLMEQSYYKGNIKTILPLSTHKLAQNKPTKLELIFEQNNKIFKIQFEIFENVILKEKLSIKATNKFSRVYEATRQADKFSVIFSEHFPAISKKSRDEFAPRKNASFFSFLLGLGLLSKIGIEHLSFKCNFNYIAGIDIVPHIINAFNLSEFLIENKNLQRQILKYLKAFDFGIQGISQKTKKAEIVAVNGNIENKMQQDLLIFTHGNNEHNFDILITDESEGTIKALDLLCRFLSVFNTGCVVIIDEIESSIHSDLVEVLIEMFADHKLNQRNAQLIFSTHQPLFLKDRDKSQIFIVEKENKINTEIYRLDEIEGVRNDENFYTKYLAGRYGGKPNIRGI